LPDLAVTRGEPALGGDFESLRADVGGSHLAQRDVYLGRCCCRHCLVDLVRPHCPLEGDGALVPWDVSLDGLQPRLLPLRFPPSADPVESLLRRLRARCRCRRPLRPAVLLLSQLWRLLLLLLSLRLLRRPRRPWGPPLLLALLLLPPGWCETVTAGRGAAPIRVPT